jgi:putative membrane protein
MPDRRSAEDHTAATIERAEIRHTTGKLSDSADRRTELAADRTAFAAERTYAAWVRTGLAALASGVGAKELLTGILPEFGLVLAGTVLELFSAFCFVAAVWRETSPGVPPPRPDTRRIPRWILFTVNGFLALVSLAALVSIWIHR